MRPSDHVDADDPQVGDVLTALVELVLAHGGRLDPDAVLVERDHDLRLELRSDDTPERPVVRVPPELLVPVDELDWVGEDLTLAGPPDHLPPPAAAALELMLELYRTCGKVRDFAATSPRVAAAGDEALAEALAGTRLSTATAITADARTAFLDSRVLSSGVGAEDGHRSVLMPLIDVVNHDPEGAEFLSGPPGVAVSCRRPLGDQQCFARYGVDRDPLDLAVSHGFTTDRTRVVNSVPVDVELDGVHRLRIRGARRAAARRPTVRSTEDGLVVDQLTFRADRPSSARTELTLAVRSWILQRGGSSADAARRSDAVVVQVLHANEVGLDAVAAVAARRATDPSRALLLEAVSRCAAVLEECAAS